MKIIDEKGRLFGKINIIDFLALLLILSFVPTFYFVNKLFKEPPALEPFSVVDVEIDCKFVKLSPELAGKIKVGDEEINERGEVIGKIIWVGETMSQEYRTNIGRRFIIFRDPRLKEVPVKVKLRCEISSKKDLYLYLYHRDAHDNRQQVLLNQPIYFKTANYTLELLPTLRDGKEDVKIEKKLKNVCLYANVILKELDENKLKLISIGDKEINEKGEVVAEIIELGKIEYNLYGVNLGGMVNVPDFNKKQVYARMKILCTMDEDGLLYFQKREITASRIFEFKTDSYATGAQLLTTVTFEPLKKISLKKWKKIKVRFTTLMPELMNVIKKGDVQKDQSGEMISMLEKILSKQPSGKVVVIEDKVAKINDPFHMDLVILFKVRSIKERDGFYVNNGALKIGSSFVFSTDLYNLRGNIIDIEGI